MPTSTTVFFSSYPKTGNAPPKKPVRTQWRVRAGNAIYKRNETTGAGAPGAERGKTDMFTILKFIAILLVLAAIGVVGYAYLGDMSANQVDVETPVTLDVE